MANKDVVIRISTGSIMKVILLVLLVILLFFLRDLVLVVLTAIVIASSIEPAVIWLKRYKVPRVLGVIFVYIAVIGSLFGVIYAFLPPLLDEAGGFIATVPVLLDAIELPLTGIGEKGGTVFSMQETILDLQATFTETSKGFVRTISGIFGGVFSFILIIVLSFYLAVQEGGIANFLRVVTPIKQEKYVLDLWRRSQIKIGRWMQGQLILSLLIGVLLYLGLTILGVPYALLLAIVAGLFELIPVFGSILAAIPAIAIAMVSGGTTLVFLVIGLYVITNQFQANLIYPLVVKKIVGVPPLLVILALIVGVKLAGFLGIILSVPIAAAIQEFVSDYERGKREIGGNEE